MIERKCDPHSDITNAASLAGRTGATAITS
jgi:hypothetical protein